MYYITTTSPLTFFYKARARTNPPNKAKLPCAMLAAAALVVAAAGLDVVVADPVFEDVVVAAVAVGETYVKVELPVGLTDETVAKVLALYEVLTVVVLLAEVELEEDVGIGVYAVPVLRVKVFVEALVMLPVAEVEELLDAPVMWKGKEYWKILASESRVSWNP